MPDNERAERVCILMGVCNGADHLDEQLQSFAGQSHASWDLIASDDGSTDAGPEILHGFAGQMAPRGNQVELVSGPCRGFVANFLGLIARTTEAQEWLAFSDQHDIWLPDRLKRGLAALRPLPRDVPALYCSRTWVTDADLGKRRLSPDYRAPPGFRNALVQNVVAGNTILLNPAAARLARAEAPAAARVPGLASHDWWLYLLITGAGGTVVRDPEPTLLYRQHGQNQIGENASWRAVKARAAMVWKGRLQRWVTANIAAMRVAEMKLTHENRALLDHFKELRAAPLPIRLAGFPRLGLYRQGRVGQAALWLALLTRRL